MNRIFRIKWFSLAVTNILMFWAGPGNTLYADQEDTGRAVKHGVYYKNDLGFTWGVFMDQRMSGLHYEGPGGIINIGRRAHRPSYIAEWSFARLQYNYSRPDHKNTIVENPGAGIRYLHLRKIYTPDSYNIYAGAEANVFGNIRLAPRLGNSFLFADMVAELRPQASTDFGTRFLWRNWNVELSMAASLLGYTLRIPEFGVSFELDEDGGVMIQGYEEMFLLPHNYMHVTTGVFIRESFRGTSNPNWFRIGYVWDYYTMAGRHNLNMNNALHQIVLELYFRVR
jgi:hypothetical protein